jgi:uncharacterized protein (DUF952 family)
MRWSGVLRGSADDRRDGFIHLSTPAQVRGTAAKWFAAEERLMLLTADAAALGAALAWEPASGGVRAGLFPHLYAPLPLDLVLSAEPVRRGPDGRHVFPDGIP